jgi:hypothetical protein
MFFEAFPFHFGTGNVAPAREAHFLSSNAWGFHPMLKQCREKYDAVNPWQCEVKDTGGLSSQVVMMDSYESSTNTMRNRGGSPPRCARSACFPINSGPPPTI